jgi:hypothetical protein
MDEVPRRQVSRPTTAASAIVPSHTAIITNNPSDTDQENARTAAATSKSAIILKYFNGCPPNYEIEGIHGVVRRSSEPDGPGLAAVLTIRAALGLPSWAC